MAPGEFHPLVQSWFDDRFEAPTEAQQAGWAAIRTGKDTHIVAPTGSGNTLAAFLWSIAGDELSRTRHFLARQMPEIRIVRIGPSGARRSRSRMRDRRSRGW